MTTARLSTDKKDQYRVIMYLKTWRKKSKIDILLGFSVVFKEYEIGTLTRNGLRTYGTEDSRMDQVKFVEDSL